jgi:hypothetical protein
MTISCAIRIVGNQDSDWLPGENHCAYTRDGVAQRLGLVIFKRFVVNTVPGSAVDLGAVRVRVSPESAVAVSHSASITEDRIDHEKPQPKELL